MTTVLQLDEASTRFILCAEEDLRHLLVMANATLVRAFVSAQADAWVATGQDDGAGLVARWAVTGLVAELATALVWALPRTGFNAWGTRQATGLLTDAVDAAVLTGHAAGGAVPSARLPTDVGAHEEALAVVGAGGVVAALVAPVTCTFTGMTAF